MYYPRPDRKTMYQWGLEERGGADWRSYKRALRKNGMDDPVHNAYQRGEVDGHYMRPYRQPYPKGKRADAYKHGYDSELQTDHMGFHHGRNY